MKNTTTYLSLAIVAALHLNVSAQQNYDTDTFENYVADQEVQESLNNAQEVLCQIANMGTEDLATMGHTKPLSHLPCAQLQAVALVQLTALLRRPQSVLNLRPQQQLAPLVMRLLQL